LNKGWAAGRQPFVFGHAAAELPDSDARVLGVLAKPGQNSTLDAGQAVSQRLPWAGFPLFYVPMAALRCDAGRIYD
jgi:hypothetical protein